MFRIFFLLFFLFQNNFSQEINSNVIVNSNQINQTNKSIFSNFEKSVSSFINSNKWSNNNFSNHEKINLNVLITIVSYSNNVNNKDIKELQLQKVDHYIVPIGHWHQISNPSNIKTHIIEIQYGEDCSESDIERVDIT